MTFEEILDWLSARTVFQLRNYHVTSREAATMPTILDDELA